MKGSNRLKAAVVGIGNMGKNHARIYSQNDETDLVALADVGDHGVKLADKYKARYYRDYHDLFNDEDLDLVSICVPTSLHKEVALEAIRNGVHVLIEKPIAKNNSDCIKIIEAGRREGVIVMVGHIERFNPAVQRLKKVLKNKIGVPSSMIARRVGIYPPQIKDANVVIDLAVHDIDVFNHLLDEEPKMVYAKMASTFRKGREDHAIIYLSYSRTECVIQVNWITPVKLRELAVTGPKGFAELNYITQDLHIYETVVEKEYDSFGDFVLNFGSPKESLESLERTEPLREELKHFIECIKKHEEPLVSGEDGMKALAVALAAIESSNSNVPIDMEEFLK